MYTIDLLNKCTLPCTTTWLLGTRICWPSLVCAYCRMVVPCWAPAFVIVRVCNPCIPSVPLFASWMAPPCVMATEGEMAINRLSLIWWEWHYVSKNQTSWSYGRSFWDLFLHYSSKCLYNLLWEIPSTFQRLSRASHFFPALQSS